MILKYLQISENGSIAFNGGKYEIGLAEIRYYAFWWWDFMERMFVFAYDNNVNVYHTLLTTTRCSQYTRS